MKKNISIHTLQKMKQNKTPVAWITAYDYPLAYVAEKSEIDMILVGDSGGMVQLGYSSTNPVTMDEMLIMAKSVNRGAPNTFIIGDMPQGSYEISNELAVTNALRFIKEAHCDAIKCEGGKRVINQIRSIVESGIVVFGHLGLTPQTVNSFGGYIPQCKTSDSFNAIIDDALCLQDCGVVAILLEAIPPEPASIIAKHLKIPVYGIGSGNLTDGQLIIFHDILGFYPNFKPKFARCFVSDIINEYQQLLSSSNTECNPQENAFLTMSQLVLKKYIQLVKNRLFPAEDQFYKISDEALESIKNTLPLER